MSESVDNEPQTASQRGAPATASTSTSAVQDAAPIRGTPWLQLRDAMPECGTRWLHCVPQRRFSVHHVPQPGDRRGSAGPAPEGGHEPGAVYVGWAREGEQGYRGFDFSGELGEVLVQTVGAALGALEGLLGTVRRDG